MTRKTLLVLGLAFFAPIVTSEAMGQGCGQTVIEEFFDCCGVQSSDTFCSGTATGDPSFFCYQGYGVCCSINFTTANTRYDYSCCDGHHVRKSAPIRFHPRVFVAGKCGPDGLQAAGSFISINRERKKEEFVLVPKLNLGSWR